MNIGNEVNELLKKYGNRFQGYFKKIEKEINGEKRCEYLVGIKEKGIEKLKEGVSIEIVLYDPIEKRIYENNNIIIANDEKLFGDINKKEIKLNKWGIERLLYEGKIIPQKSFKDYIRIENIDY